MDDITKIFVAVEPLPLAKGQMSTPWTDEQKNTLRQQWEGSNLSAREIGRLLGKTKNAVIGQVHRLGLSERKSGARKAKIGSTERVVSTERKVAIPRKRIKAVPQKAPPLTPLRPDITPVGIMGLRRNSCRAIVGRGADGLALYCDDDCFWDPQLGRFKPFCEAHGAIYYNHDTERYRR